jgi:serine protease Do
MNEEKPRRKSILPYVLLLLLMAGIAVAAVIVQANSGVIEQPPEETYETLPVGTGAGIEVFISQAERPRLSEEAYENIETGLFTKTGIADWVIPSQKTVVVYKGDMLAPSMYGTAAVLSEDGFLLTCAHVVDEAIKVEIYMGEDEFKVAEIVAIEKPSDLALLKIEASGLTPVIFGQSSEVLLGEETVCASAAGRYPDTLTFGSVTHLNRGIENGYIEDKSVPMMQVSCFLNPGSSGAPVFNMYGQCIGIAASKVNSPGFEGIGFIISADYAVSIAEKMMGEAGKYPANAEVANKAGNGFLITEAVTGSENGFFITEPDLLVTE